jgi:hypothetical protein
VRWWRYNGNGTANSNKQEKKNNKKKLIKNKIK